MNTVNDLYRRRQGASPSACPPDPCVCSTCGMLDCLCRPRFFAGQILTADDLNRLDGYIRGKHRLHNRQLHGWGVVNGLEVTCNPCGDGVAVGCGYALSPCGDDIVVCDAVSVDVCALIKRCCTDEVQDPCDPPRRPRPRDCEEGEQEWILAIRYAETPTRGVKPLRTPDCTPDCTGGCACGNSGGGCSGACGGRCGGAAAPKKRSAPVQCEPTVVCEGFAFEVYRKPPEPDDPRGDDRPDTLNPQSPLVQRFQCCMALLLTSLPKMPGPLQVPATAAAAQAWYAWIVAMRALLRRYFASHGSTNCELLARFDTIPFPPAGTLANAGAIHVTALLLVVVWIDALLACFCSAMLPPCPPPSTEVRVPLASIHVSGHPCRVLRICNWSAHRKFATTMPALQYWLGVFPYGAALRKLFERMCCARPPEYTPQRGDDPQPVPAPPVPGAAPAQPGVAFGAAAPDRDHDGNHDGNQDETQDGARGAWEHATGRLNPTLDEPERITAARSLLTAALGRGGRTLHPGMLAEGLMLPAQHGGHGEHGGQDQGLSGAELANLPQLLAANGLLRPLVQASLPPSLSALAGLAGLDAFGGAGDQPAAAELAALRGELAALQASVKAQAAQIAQLAPRDPTPAPARGKRRHKEE